MTSSDHFGVVNYSMSQQDDKITVMDVESPTSREDHNLLLAPWNNHNHIMFNETPSPKIPRSPSSIFSYPPKSPGAGSNGMRYESPAMIRIA